MQIISDYQDKIKTKMSNIKKLKEIEADDQNVREVLEVMRDFYKRDLDMINEHELITIGGKILGYYTSISTTSTFKEAEYKASEQSYNELLSSMIIFNKDDNVGITEARNIAKDQLKDVSSDLIEKEYYSKTYEAIMKATQTTLSFIQSTLRIKTNEMHGGKLNDNN